MRCTETHSGTREVYGPRGQIIDILPPDGCTDPHDRDAIKADATDSILAALDNVRKLFSGLPTSRSQNFELHNAAIHLAGLVRAVGYMVCTAEDADA